ncbi:MAG: phage tail protein [Bacteroidetes bacterium]|nr:phage tail protein [Bacteroidota bacterium]
MAEYKTPGVYVEEISTLPPSAGQVPTAIPAFIGYTERADKNGKSLINVPTHITSLLEFRELFGGAYRPEKIFVNLDDKNGIRSIELEKRYFMYDNMRMFFSNGGGQCFIVSVGTYGEDIDKDKLASGVDACLKQDLPTMLVCPDAVLLAKKDDCYTIQQQMLAQCNKLQDRVSVLDVFDGYKDRSDEDVVLNFRNGIGVNFLKYGAAYYPWLQTTLNTDFSYGNIVLKDGDGNVVDLSGLVSDPTAVNNLKQVINDMQTILNFIQNPFGEETPVPLSDKFFKVDEGALKTKAELTHYATVIKEFALKLIALQTSGDIHNASIRNELKSKVNYSSVMANVLRSVTAIDLAASLGVVDPAADFPEYELEKVAPSPALAGIEAEDLLVQKAKGLFNKIFDSLVDVLSSVKKDAVSIQELHDKIVFDTNPLYKSIVSEINKEISKLPPSGAMAGVYAMVDTNRGVWKAPANVSLASTVKPWVKIDNDDQEDLNVDLTGGKSVNAIRAFVGQGTLVWGGRTLAGNDNEWRYISVRRFFIMVEKSLKLATNWAVFEPNEEITWLKVKAMMNNFLTNLWKQGALTGGSPGDAFFVKIGLGETMTQIDILEGRMNVEIGLAVVRPAEFIVLKFSHKFDIS